MRAPDFRKKERSIAENRPVGLTEERGVLQIEGDRCGSRVDCAACKGLIMGAVNEIEVRQERMNSYNGKTVMA